MYTDAILNVFLVFLSVLFLSDSAVHVVRYACASLGELARSGPLPATAVDVENVIGRLKEIIRETADVNVRWNNNHVLYMYRIIGNFNA